MEDWQEEFTEQIRYENKSRNDEMLRNYKSDVVKGEDIYIGFCLWCNCQGDTDDKLRSNAQVFAKWLKRHNITLTEYQRRWIAENHFGWQFTWNSEKNEWESKKI